MIPTEPCNPLKFLSARGLGAATLTAFLQASCSGRVVGYPVNVVGKARDVDSGRVPLVLPIHTVRDVTSMSSDGVEVAGHFPWAQ